jgi:hypothetical protein
MKHVGGGGGNLMELKFCKLFSPHELSITEILPEYKENINKIFMKMSKKNLNQKLS